MKTFLALALTTLGTAALLLRQLGQRGRGRHQQRWRVNAADATMQLGAWQ